MLRDNLAGLIEPMIDRAGAHPLGGHSKHGPTGGCSRSTELTIVVLKRSWRPTFRWKTGRQAEKAKCPGFEVTTAAHDSRAVGTALHQSHRTIDPQCLKKSPPRRGGIYALTKNAPSPFHAEPTQSRYHASVFPEFEPTFVFALASACTTSQITGRHAAGTILNCLAATNDEPERHHPRGVSLRSHDLPVPGKERHRQHPSPSPFS
jgi:hypothetical protein